MTIENHLYTQYINIDKISDVTSFEDRFLQHHRPTLGIFIDMNCHETENILKMCSYERLFNDHYHWLIYDQTGNIIRFHNLFSQFNMSIDANLIYALDRQYKHLRNYYGEIGVDQSFSKEIIYTLSDPYDRDGMNMNLTTLYILYDVYNNGHHIGGKLNMTLDREIACDRTSCRLVQFLSKLYLRPKYGNRNSMRDVTWRIAVVITAIPITLPISTLQEFVRSEYNPHIDTFARFGYKLVMLLEDCLESNMSYKYFNIWGLTEASGAAVGALVTETVDFVSTPFLVTPARLKYLRAIAETGGFGTTCMFRTPRNLGAFKADVFLQPFSWAVWLVFVFCLVMCSIFLWSAFRVEHHRLRCYLDFVPSFLTTCLIAFGSACIQGSNLIPRSTGGRLAFCSLSFISFIMYNYYSSLVVSSLLGSPIKSDIKTMDDLADSTLEVGLEPLPYNMVYLNTSQLPSIRRFVKRKIESKKDPQSVWMSVEEGIRRVRDEPGFVYVVEASNGYPLIEKLYEPQEICDLNEVRLRSEKSLYTVLHKNSTYKEIVRLKEVRMLETGVYARHYRHWIRTSLNCLANNFVIDVGMEYVAPIFIFLLAAYLVVILLLIMEICYQKYTVKNVRMEINY